MADSATTTPDHPRLHARPAPRPLTQDLFRRRLRFAAFAALSAAATTVLGVAVAGPASASLVWADDPCEDRGGQVALAPDFSVLGPDAAAAYAVCADGTVVHHGPAGGELTDALAALAPADYVDVAVTPDGSGAYVVTRSGQVETVGTATAGEPSGSGGYGAWAAVDQLLGFAPAAAPAVADVVGIELTPAADGYWVTSADGQVTGYGAAPDLASALPPAAPVVAFAPSGVDGGWLAAANGQVLPVGSAPDLGSVTEQLPPGDSVVGLVPTPAGDGYWAVTGGGEILPGGAAAAETDAAMCREQVNAAPPFVGAVGDPRAEAPASLWTYTVHGGICAFAPGA